MYAFQKSLQGHGFEISSFTDSLLAIQSFRKYHRHYSTIVSDIRMPKMDGIALAREARTISPTVKIVLITAFEIAASVAELRLLGVSELLNKPLSGSTLASIISNHITPNRLLETIHVCDECKALFIFESDVADHKALLGHRRFQHMPFDAI